MKTHPSVTSRGMKAIVLYIKEAVPHRVVLHVTAEHTRLKAINARLNSVLLKRYAFHET